MRIAFVTDTYTPEVNGIVASTEGFARLLAQRGHELLVLAPEYPDHTDDPPAGVRVVRFRSHAYPLNRASHGAFPSRSTLQRELEAFGPDVVHIHTTFGMGWAGIAAARKMGVPNVQTYHNFLPGMARYTQLASRLARLAPRALEMRTTRSRIADRLVARFTHLLYDKADLVLAPSEVMCTMLRSIGIRPRAVYLTNGLELDDFPAKDDWSPSGVVLHTGRLSHEKNADVVVRAFALLAAEDPSIALHVLGEGPSKPALQQLAADLGLTDRVVFGGWLSPEELSSAYRGADVWVTASTFETQGIVLLEAMASGVPVVAADALAAPEMAGDGEQALIVPPFDARAMAEAIRTLLDDRTLRERFGRSGIERARAVHDKREATVRLESLYEGLLRG